MAGVYVHLMHSCTIILTLGPALLKLLPLLHHSNTLPNHEMSPPDMSTSEMTDCEMSTHWWSTHEMYTHEMSTHEMSPHECLHMR